MGDSKTDIQPANDADVIARVFATISSRRGTDPSTSYVSGLLDKGTSAIARKVGEEAVEAIVAALDEGPEQVVAESADLLFHLMVLWADQGVKPADIFQELARREGISGIEEKRQRKE